jgi:hypothetical protein
MRAAIVLTAALAGTAAAQFQPGFGNGSIAGTPNFYPWAYNYGWNQSFTLSNGIGNLTYQQNNGYGNFAGQRFGFNTYQMQQQLLQQQALNAYQYAYAQQSFLMNPSLAPYIAAQQQFATGGFGNFGGINYGYNYNFNQSAGFANPWGGQVAGQFLPGQIGITQFEPGRFVRVAPDVAVNTATGTVLQPYSGVAYTNEGPFYRLPGTGIFSPYGAYLPGSGIYFNPFNGAAYNPRTGVIRR